MQLQKTIIPYSQTAQFGKLFLAYTEGKLKQFYSFEPSLAGIKSFTEKNTYENLNRELLVEELQEQNEDIKVSSTTQKNIDLLKNKNTYTVTTGHQLCLATGPLYFIYKIISVINLCEKLNADNSDKKFVPVYWMASEDHDFEEINHINLFSKKITWSTNQKGRVGDFSLENMDVVLNEIKEALGENKNAATILEILKSAYSQKNLAHATRYLVNELFGKYGLVVLDGNSKKLKQAFKEEIQKDIFENFAFKQISATIEELKNSGYETQVTPREINLFYACKNFRERIVKENFKYKILNTDLVFSYEELQNKIDNETENFSPNVVLRPVYQQKILPNAVYVGGPGELAYWLEYKVMFEEAKIPFPVLMPRNFILYLEKNLQQKMQKLNLKTEDFFSGKNKLAKNYVLTQHPFSLENEKESVKKLFTEIRSNISQVDKTLEGATEAELQKALKGIETLEQKAIRSIKQKNEQSINQIETIYARLFPNEIPHERVDNFLRFYLNNPDFIDDIKNNTSSFVSESGLVVLSEN